MISIKERFQSEKGYEVFKNNNDLNNGKKMLPKELVGILKQEFAGISDNQCYGVIYRACGKDRILKREDKFYRLLTKEEKEKKLDGLQRTKKEISQFIAKLEDIPAVQFRSPQDFSAYKSILNELYDLQK